MQVLQQAIRRPISEWQLGVSISGRA